MEKNLLDEYCELVREYTDAPEVFIDATGYWLISSTIGKFVNILNSKKRHPYANLYVVLSSIPAATRRSTLVSLASDVYLRVWTDFFTNNLGNRASKLDEVKKIKDINEDAAREVIGKDMAFDSSVENFTTEGICDAIMDSQLDAYAIVCTEFGLTMQKTKNNYMSDMPTFLSKLFDGLPYKQLLSRRGKNVMSRIIPGGLYVTLLGELQEPQLFFDERDLQQGFMRRLLIVYLKPSDLSMDNWKSPFDETNSYPNAEIDQITKEIVNRMESLKQKKINAILSPTAKNVLNKISTQTHRNLIESDGNDQSLYEIGLAETLQKLCVLRAISEPNREKDDLIQITMDDFRDVTSFMGGVQKNLSEALDSISNPREKQKMLTDEPTFNNILKIIEKAGGIITSGDLAQKLGLSKVKIGVYIETLMEQGAIYAVAVKKQGVKWKVYYTNSREYAENNVREHQKSDIRKVEFCDDYYELQRLIKS